MLVPAAFTYLCWAVVSTAAVGYVPEALKMQHNFARIGFTNSAEEAPYLVQKEQRGNAVILTYHCTGFPVSAWVDKQLELESALNMLIASVKEGNDRRTVSLCCIPPEHVFDTIEWHERYILRNEDNKLILGRGLMGDVIIDIDKTPHILIGGNTGSGKSRLIKDIEQLSDGTGVTGRRVLLDDGFVPLERRQAVSTSLVAHLGQNMRFVLDTSVGAFLRLHAACRQKEIRESDTLRKLWEKYSRE